MCSLNGIAHNLVPVLGQVVGTYGYAALDRVQTARLTSKSDVWSFGVVLFEILTGRRLLDRNHPRVEQKLLAWVKQFPVESGAFSMILDPRLEGKYSLSAARLTAKLANYCLSRYLKDHPSMREVLESLKKAVKATKTCIQMESSEEQHESNITGTEGVKMTNSESARRQLFHLSKLRMLAQKVEGNLRSCSRLQSSHDIFL